jgi:mono/diheme cytochrome c family protein
MIERLSVRLLLALLLGFGVSVIGAYAQDAANGEALFKQKCTTCHTAKKVLTGVRKTAASERAAHLEKFLPTHFAPDPAQRKAIADYLVAEAAK